MLVASHTFLVVSAFTETAAPSRTLTGIVSVLKQVKEVGSKRAK